MSAPSSEEEEPSTPPVCSYSFVREGTPDPFTGYDGSSLKRCTRCKGAYYVNIDAQKSHWKRHKRCCKLVDERLLASISERSLDECIESLTRCLRRSAGAPVPPETYRVIKRVRDLFYDDDDGSDVAAYRLHTLARNQIFTPGELAYALDLAAAPHMARLLFGTEEDLLSEKNRIARDHLARYNGRPSEEFIEDVEDAEEKEELTKWVEKYDDLDTWGQPASMSFCYLYYNLVVAGAVQADVSHSSVHDGRGRLRGGNPQNGAKSPDCLLATAALRRAMELWTDPLVLASCGDAMAPAASLALTAVKSYVQWGIVGSPQFCRKHELAPGLAIDGLVMTLMSELSEGAGSAEYSMKLLKIVGDISRTDCEGVAGPWIDLPIERRARCALASVKFVTEFDGERASFMGRNIEMPAEDVSSIFKTICGMQNPVDTHVAKSVWKKAADDGESIGPEASGFNAGSRAFFYHLLQENTSSDEWKDLDMVQLVKDFIDVPNIHRAPPGDVKAKEKDECLRKARGDKRHEEMNEMFRDVGRRN